MNIMQQSITHYLLMSQEGKPSQSNQQENNEIHEKKIKGPRIGQVLVFPNGEQQIILGEKLEMKEQQNMQQGTHTIVLPQRRQSEPFGNNNLRKLANTSQTMSPVAVPKVSNNEIKIGQQDPASQSVPARITRCPDCNSLLHINYSCTPFTLAWSVFLLLGLTCWVPWVVDACKRSQSRCLTCDKVIQTYEPSCC